MPAPKPNAIDYVEIPSRDLQKTRVFFESLFAWKFTDYGPEYTAFEDGRLSGGFFKSSAIAQTANGSALIVFYSPQLESIRDEPSNSMRRSHAIFSVSPADAVSTSPNPAAANSQSGRTAEEALINSPARAPRI